MKLETTGRKIIGNNRGMISADFIFSLTLAVGLGIVLFSLCFTLSMAEIGQYITFSTARAAAAAHESPEKQTQMGKDKFAELMANSVIKGLFARSESSWFLLGTSSAGTTPSADIRGGYQGSNFLSDYAISDSDRLPPTGVKILFIPKILNLKLPFLGNTSSDTETGFKANLTVFMIREPSQSECTTQVGTTRRDAILNLGSGRYKAVGSSTASAYIAMEDNGC